jgi:hypothetical protein
VRHVKTRSTGAYNSPHLLEDRLHRKLQRFGIQAPPAAEVPGLRSGRRLEVDLSLDIDLGDGEVKAVRRTTTTQLVRSGWVMFAPYEAEPAVHNSDAAPRRALWSRNDPVSILLRWPRSHRLESTAARKGEGPGNDAGVGGPACSGCGHVDRLITWPDS